MLHSNPLDFNLWFLLPFKILKNRKQKVSLVTFIIHSIQEESLETRMNNFKQAMQEDYNEQLRNTSEWRSTAEKQMNEMKYLLQGIKFFEVSYRKKIFLFNINKTNCWFIVDLFCHLRYKRTVFELWNFEK